MFPTTSDILPEWYPQYLKRIKSILNDGHSLVLVSKPHFDVWGKLAEELLDYKERIIIRFTISSQNNELLKLMEPGAPFFEERFGCLKLMHSKKYATSISMEPAIDLLKTPDLIKKLLPYCTADLWVGTLNHIKKLRILNQNKPEVLKAFDIIEANQQHNSNTVAILCEIKNISNKIVFKAGDKYRPDFRSMLGLSPSPFGVAEWGDNRKKNINYNLLKGCTHDCVYCYAKQDQIQKGVSTGESWKTPILKRSQPSCFRQEL